MSVMAIDQRRYAFLCNNRFGVFYWDIDDKVVVMSDTPNGPVRGAGAFVVSQDRTGYWSARTRPARRIDLDALKLDGEL